MAEQQKYFRVLDGGDNGGVETGMVYYCAEYTAHSGERDTLSLKGVIRIESLTETNEFHSDLVQPTDMQVYIDGSYHTSTVPDPR